MYNYKRMYEYFKWVQDVAVNIFQSFAGLKLHTYNILCPLKNFF